MSDTKLGNPNWKKGISANPDTQFKPGQSGNPAGRPKLDPPITSYLREILEQKISEKKKPETNKELIAQAIIMHAAKGNSGYLKELLERLEGKIPQGVFVPEGQAITLRVKYDRDGKRRNDK